MSKYAYHDISDFKFGTTAQAAATIQPLTTRLGIGSMGAWSTADATTLNDTDQQIEPISKAPGTLTIDGFFDPADTSITALEDAHDSGDEHHLEYTLGGKVYAWPVYVTDLSVDAATGGLVTFTASFTAAGAYTKTAAAS